MKTLRTLGSPIALAAALALAAPLFIGSATASDRNVDRTVSIDPSTRWINVNGGETIRFIANGESFDHRFTSFTHSAVYDLGKIAPAGAIDRSLKVYVSPDPAHSG